MDSIYLSGLQMVPGIGNTRLKKLITFFGSAQQALKADRRDLFLCGCLDDTLCNNLLVYREKIDIYKIAAQLEKHQVKICTLDDADYPVLLKNIFDPPLLLYYKGILPTNEHILISIVGSRRASAYGKNAAHMLSSELASAGVWVVSGAARGIDTAAHQGAITKGHTIAVLGCGLDINYPPENSKLFLSIPEHGAIISEYPLGTAPHKGFFPARNRIINGLSRGVIVVEAAERSGALITAEFALEEGRDVFAVPGSIFSASSRGTHRLIKQGAKLIEHAADVLEEYDISPRQYPEQTAVFELTVNEKGVLELLSHDNPMEIEEIVLKTKLPPTTVAHILLQLELSGLAAEYGAQRYLRTAREVNK